MNPRSRIIVIVLTGAILVALAAGLLPRLELAQEDLYRPPAAEARRNPVLAATRYLEASGVPARAVDGLEDLPGTGTAVVLMPREVALPPALAEDLAGWVRRGGHLVFSPCQGGGWEGSRAGGTGLMRELGITVDCSTGIPDLAAGPEPGGVSLEPSLISFDDPEEVLLVRVPWITLSSVDPNDPVDGVEVPSRALMLGRGTASVLGSMDLFTNRKIGEDDNARLLERLTTLNGVPEEVWLVYGTRRAGLAALLWNRAWPVWVAFGLALAAFLARSMVRNGSRIGTAAGGSRSLLDHVEAVGALLWRLDRDALYQGVRQEVQRAVSERRPDLLGRRGRSPAESASRSRLGEVPARSVGRVLAAEAPSTREEFFRAVRRLDSIRRSL